MKNYWHIFGFVLTLILVLNVAGFAQKRTVKQRPRTASTAAAKTGNAAELQQGATQIADQIKNLSRFLYLLGGIAKGIETVDAAVQRGDASRPVIEQNNKNKGTVVLTIRNFRQGLDELEAKFRFSAKLKEFYPPLFGISQIAATAEENAQNGKIDAAGREMLDVLNKLTDALLKMK